MHNRHDAYQRGNGWPLAWQPQPGEVLAGVIDHYGIGDTPQGPVWTVVVNVESTGEPVRLWLSSTTLLSLFAQHQPNLGERIRVGYGWRDLDNSYHRWMLVVDRPEILDFSPLGGEAVDEAPWHRKKGLALARLEPIALVAPRRTPDRPRTQAGALLSMADAVRLTTLKAIVWGHRLTVHLLGHVWHPTLRPPR